jgi:hypothetical protein
VPNHPSYHDAQEQFYITDPSLFDTFVGSYRFAVVIKFIKMWKLLFLLK